MGRLAPLVVCGLLAACAHAFKYDLTIALDKIDPGMSDQTNIISEGPMYAPKQGGFGGGGDSYVETQFRIKSMSGDAGELMLSINTGVFDADTLPALGSDGDVLNLCCTQALEKTNKCGEAKAGEMINNWSKVTGLPAGTSTIKSVTVPAKVGTALTAATRASVVHEGNQQVYVVVCPMTTTSSAPALELEAVVTFRNPHGYLPGQVYGFLPFYIVLFVAYLGLLLWYAAMMVMHRQHLISMQWLILAVMILGAIEVTVWFGTFNSKNDSGVPTPCSVCPVTSDYIAAVVLNVFKRAVSRVLLLVITLGYGIVSTQLPVKTMVAIGGLAAVYIGVSAMDDVAMETSYANGVSNWGFPVLICDLIFVVASYSGMKNLNNKLVTEGQSAKLELYARLWSTLTYSMMAWIVIAFLQISITEQLLPMPWKFRFVFDKFWDILYFTMLVSVAILWIPGERSYQYAFYAQPADNEADAEAVEDFMVPDAGIELADAKKGGAGAPGSFIIEEEAGADNDEDWSDEGEGGATAVPPPAAGKAAAPAAKAAAPPKAGKGGSK